MEQINKSIENNENKISNPSKICTKGVQSQMGSICHGACRNWLHFDCLSRVETKIQAIKHGQLRVSCRCPDCEYEARDDRNQFTIKKCPPNSCYFQDGLSGKELSERCISYVTEHPEPKITNKAEHECSKTGLAVQYPDFNSSTDLVESLCYQLKCKSSPPGPVDRSLKSPTYPIRFITPEPTCITTLPESACCHLKLKLFQSSAAKKSSKTINSQSTNQQPIPSQKCSDPLSNKILPDYCSLKYKLSQPSSVEQPSKCLPQKSVSPDPVSVVDLPDNACCHMKCNFFQPNPSAQYPKSPSRTKYKNPEPVLKRNQLETTHSQPKSKPLKLSPTEVQPKLPTKSVSPKPICISDCDCCRLKCKFYQNESTELSPRFLSKSRAFEFYSIQENSCCASKYKASQTSFREDSPSVISTPTGNLPPEHNYMPGLPQTPYQPKFYSPETIPESDDIESLRHTETITPPTLFPEDQNVNMLSTDSKTPCSLSFSAITLMEAQKTCQSQAKTPSKLSQSCTCVNEDNKKQSLVTESLITNYKASQKVLYTTIEHLCSTVGQLSNQLNDIMLKLVMEMNTKK